MRSALPQPLNRWNMREPRCCQCLHSRIDPSVRSPYANAVCLLMPGFGPFSVSWVACRKFQRRELHSRNWNGNAKTVQRMNHG